MGQRLLQMIEMYGGPAKLALLKIMNMSCMFLLSINMQNLKWQRYGRVYRFDEGTEERVVCYASFGGLLMALTGSFRFLSSITVGQNIYLLMRK